MKSRLCLAALVMAALCAWGFAAANAQENAAHHKITAQEVAEALADPSANISYFNVSYRGYMDVGPFDDMNHEIRLNGAGFFRLPNKTSVMYRLYLPTYITTFPFDNSGIGDFLLSAYWVPTKGNLIIGPGAALLTPTATQNYYGTGKWSAGPTLIVAQKVPGKYTAGGLLTHAWSFAGDDARDDVSLSTIQPVFTYFLGRGTSVSFASETTYNWEAEKDGWTVPLTFAAGQILPPFGKFFVGVAVAATYYIEKSEYVQEWDVRGLVSIVLP